MHGQGHRRDGGGAITLRTTGRRLHDVRWWRWLLLCVIALAAACAPADDGTEELTLFAAASLRVVSAELEAAWLESHPDVPLVIATGASNVLAAQIEEGAFADVFISADDAHARRLADEGHTAAAPILFARNELTLVARLDGPVTEAADLATPGTGIVVGGPGTPIGSYTALAIERLAQLMPEPAAFAEAVAANIVSREDNVRAALAKVELGEADAAFVYRTDALGSEATTEVELPPEARVAATYGAVQVSDKADAAEFLAWLRGPTAAIVLSHAGFVVPA